MQQVIDFAKGPLFGLTFLIMVLGLARHVVIQSYTLTIRKGRRLRNVSWKKIIGESLTWAVPVKHMIPGTIFFSTASFVSHIGIILVPLFQVEHIALWESFLGVGLPSLGAGAADFLTLITLVCIACLLGCRIFVNRQRAMSEGADYLLLVMLFIPFATGYLAAHPGVNPLRWDVMMLIHILSAECLFVMIPFTKLAHIVLFFFDRISSLHWQLRPGAGDRVAEALLEEEVSY
jgi:nitrate reductase gamma subunit